VKVQEIFGERLGRDVHMYSISLDSERDTVEDLAEYAELYGCGEGWTFFTGDFDEIEKIRTAPSSAQELETSNASIIAPFPRTFESKNATVNLFINDEWTDRPEGYWESYRDNVKAVTTDDVLRVAQEHLHPDNMVFMIVGNWDEIEGGDLEGRASMDDFYGGSHTTLPLRDPLTQEPINN